VWESSGNADGAFHAEGDRQKTWQVMQESGALITYRIRDNPELKDAIKGMQNAITDEK